MISGLLKKKESSYLGVDIGSGSIKFVELEDVSGRPKLVTYGLLDMETEISNDNAKTKDKRTAGLLSALLKEGGASSKQVIGALPNFSVFSSVLSLPKREDQDISQAVKWEAKKFVPMPIENVVLDWKEIESKQDIKQKLSDPAKTNKNGESSDLSDFGSKKIDEKSSSIRVLLTAAPRHMVEKYVNIFKTAGLNLISLETESFALARSIVGNDPSAVLVVDIGSLTTDITVVDNGIPVFSRSISVGGKTITRSVSSSMGIDEERAEQFKRDIGIGVGTEISGVEKVISQSFGSVVNEMRYLLDLQKESGFGSVEKVLLTGGSSFLPSLDKFISKSLGIRAFIANPWARVSYPKELASVLDELGPRMSVAIGLAMREIG